MFRDGLFELKWRTVAQRRVATTGIIKAFDVIEEHQPGGSAGGRNGSAEAFGFERGKEAFHYGIVVRISAAAHRATGFRLLQ